MFYCSSTDLIACIAGKVVEWLVDWICTPVYRFDQFPLSPLTNFVSQSLGHTSIYTT